jgi:hypothetical protein
MNQKGNTLTGGLIGVIATIIVLVIIATVFPIIRDSIEEKQDYVFDKEDGYLRIINKTQMEGNMLIIPDQIDGAFVKNVYLGRLDDLEAVYIPEHVKEINGAYGIKRFEVDEKNRYLTTFKGSLYSKDLKKLYIIVDSEDGTLELPKELRNTEGAIWPHQINKIIFNCPISQIYFDTSLGKIFSDASEVIFAEDEQDYFEENHIIYRDNYKELVSTLETYDEKDVIIRDEVEKICDHAFETRKIESINTNNVKEIEEGAFYFCTNLKTIVLGDDIDTIKKDTFSNCSKIEGIIFPKNLKYIDEEAFCDSGIKNLELPEGLLEIGERAFFDCKIETLYFPSTIRSIGKEAFTDYYGGKKSKLTKVKIPAGTIIGENAFPKQVIVEFE